MATRKPVIHHFSYSPPSRFAVLTAKTLGLDVEIREVDMFNGGHLTPEYKAINPASTVPVLVDDDGTSVFDSSAISIYLVEKYAPNHSLYPKDLKLRARINERLFYVASYLFPRMYQIFVPGYFGNENEVPEEKVEEILRGYETIEVFLKGDKYLAGNAVTLPDLFLWANMESLDQVIPIDKEKFPNFIAWLERMGKLPTYELNKEGADGHIAFYRDCIAKRLAQEIEA